MRDAKRRIRKGETSGVVPVTPTVEETLPSTEVEPEMDQDELMSENSD